MADATSQDIIINRSPMPPTLTLAPVFLTWRSLSRIDLSVFLRSISTYIHRVTSFRDILPCLSARITELLVEVSQKSHLIHTLSSTLILKGCIIRSRRYELDIETLRNSFILFNRRYGNISNLLMKQYASSNRFAYLRRHCIINSSKPP